MNLGLDLEQIENHDYPTRRIEGKTDGGEFDETPWTILHEFLYPGEAIWAARAIWRTGKYTVIRVVNERTGFTSDTISKE